MTEFLFVMTIINCGAVLALAFFQIRDQCRTDDKFEQWIEGMANMTDDIGHLNTRVHVLRRHLVEDRGLTPAPRTVQHE